MDPEQIIHQAARQHLGELNQLLSEIQRERSLALRQWYRVNRDTQARWDMLIKQRDDLRGALGEV